MYYYVGGLVSAWNKIFAVVIISMIPILAFYLFAQKKFIQGFAGGLNSPPTRAASNSDLPETAAFASGTNAIAD